MTMINVEFYKKTGKWYTDITMELNIAVWETQELIDGIEKYIGDKNILADMDYVFEATSEQGVNRQMVIKSR